MSRPEAQAAVRVTPNYLIDSLHLPEGTVIVGAEWDDMRDVLLLYVTHKDLPARSFLWRPAPRVNVLISREPSAEKQGYDYSSKYVVDETPVAKLVF